MDQDALEAEGRKFGWVGKTLLFLTIALALVLLYYSTWAAVTFIELAHDVPNPWTVADVTLIGFPVFLLGIVIAANYALLRGKLVPLAICFGLAVVDFAILAATFE